MGHAASGVGNEILQDAGGPIENSRGRQELGVLSQMKWNNKRHVSTVAPTEWPSEFCRLLVAVWWDSRCGPKCSMA